MQRDYTFFDDNIDCVVRVLDLALSAGLAGAYIAADLGTSGAPCRIYNIGNHNPKLLLRFIEVIEENLDKMAAKQFLSLQKGEVPTICADIEDLMRDTGFASNTPFVMSIIRFLKWHQVNYPSGSA